MEKLNVKGMALGFGITFGGYLLLIGWASMLGWGTERVEIVSSIYIGYEPTFIGSLIGALWGFVDGAIGGAVVTLIYNAVSKKK
jgi:hypothetical protein